MYGVHLTGVQDSGLCHVSLSPSSSYIAVITLGLFCQFVAVVAVAAKVQWGIGVVLYFVGIYSVLTVVYCWLCVIVLLERFCFSASNK